MNVDTTPGSSTDYHSYADEAARSLKSALKVSGGNLNHALSYYNTGHLTGGYGTSTIMPLAVQGGYHAGSNDRPIHVNVNVDGHKVTRSRILRGHKA